MSEEQKVLNWAEVRQHAETRPTMYIGDPATAHRLAILECLRLVWQAKVFRRPKSVKIDLSPTQYIMRVECGPLIRPIQQNFRFGMGQTLGGAWHTDSRAYSEKFAREERERGIPYQRKRWNSGWRYCFCGPLGPRLDAPVSPHIFAHLLVWGVRTNEGLWCEGWADAMPIGTPFLLTDVTQACPRIEIRVFGKANVRLRGQKMRSIASSGVHAGGQLHFYSPGIHSRGKPCVTSVIKGTIAYRSAGGSPPGSTMVYRPALYGGRRTVV
jgi:hypothetical protein